MNKGTVRERPAIPEFMGMGFIVPLWTDLDVKFLMMVVFNGIHLQKNFTSIVVQHTLADHLPKHARPSLILKPNCPWRVKTPIFNISLLQLYMFWHFNPNFTVAPTYYMGRHTP